MRKVYFEIPQWGVLLDAETHEKVLEAPREYCVKVAGIENWEIVDPPEVGKRLDNMADRVNAALEVFRREKGGK